jgi:hypothetical protein
MGFVKRAAIRAMTANQAQAHAAQASQSHSDANQQAQAEIKDVTMSDVNAEDVPGEGEKATPNASPLLIFRSEWRDHPAHSTNRSSVGSCGCTSFYTWCLGSYRGSEPDSEDSIPTPDPLHGNAG